MSATKERPKAKTICLRKTTVKRGKELAKLYNRSFSGLLAQLVDQDWEKRIGKAA